MRRTALRLLLLAITAAPARAQLIDHQPHNTGGPAADTQYLNMFNQERWQLLADDFTLKSDSMVARISWWGFFDQDNPPASETMRIRVRTARPSDGLPGDLIYEQIAVDPTRTATGRIVLVGNSPREYYYQFNLPTPLQLSAQTLYWLEIAQLGDLNTAFRWEYSVTDPNSFAVLNLNGPDWRIATIDGVSLAFQLTAFPEPATAMLLAAAATIAILGRKFSTLN